MNSLLTQAVFNAIKRADRPPTAQAIFLAVRKEIPHTTRAQVSTELSGLEKKARITHSAVGLPVRFKLPVKKAP